MIDDARDTSQGDAAGVEPNCRRSRQRPSKANCIVTCMSVNIIFYTCLRNKDLQLESRLFEPLSDDWTIPDHLSIIPDPRMPLCEAYSALDSSIA